MYTSSWFTSLCNRNEHNNVKQLCSYCCSVVLDSLQPHGLEHAKPPCPSPFPKVCPSSCTLHGWCHPVILSSDPSPSALNLSQHQGFFHELAVCIKRPKYWSFSFSIHPSNKYSGLISLKIDWFDLLAVQGTLGSLLQHHSSKASILWHSASFTVQLSQPYVTNGKTTALTIWTFGSTVMSVSTHCLALSQLSCQGASFF